MHTTDPECLRGLISAQKSGWALDGALYTDPAVFALEMERFILPRWLYAGHISRIPEPGDYFTYRVGSESLLVIRCEGGEIAALHNVCRHKGSPLCEEGAGNARRLVCPYHQWVYATDGRLLSARLMPDSFDCSAFGLARAHVHVCHGLIFVCIASEPPAFPEPEYEWLAPYGLDSAKVAYTASYDVCANWKILVENFLECYHCAVVHPEYTRVTAGAGHSFRSSEEITAQAGRTKADVQAAGAALGLAPDRPCILFRRGAVTQSLDGAPVAPLMGAHRDYDGAMIGLWIGWTLEMEANPDHVTAFRFTPIGAAHTNVEVHWLVRGDAVEGVDYQLDRLTTFWRITGEQDWQICERVHHGVQSRAYHPGPLSEAEFAVKDFLDEWKRSLTLSSA